MHSQVWLAQGEISIRFVHRYVVFTFNMYIYHPLIFVFSHFINRIIEKLETQEVQTISF